MLWYIMLCACMRREKERERERERETDRHVLMSAQKRYP